MTVCVAKLVDLSVQSRVIKVAQSVQRASYRCVLVGLESREGRKVRGLNGIKLIEISARSNRFASSLGRPLRVIEKLTKYIAMLWQINPRVYCAHDVITLGAALVMARLRRAKVIYMGDELEYGRSASNVWYRIRNRLVGWSLGPLLRNCDSVMQADSHRAKHLAMKYRLKNVGVLRNVPDVQEAIDPIDIRKRKGLSSRSIVLMYHGTLGHGRGIEAIVRAVQSLPADEDYVLLLIGWGSKRYMQRLGRIIEEGVKSSPHLKMLLMDPVDQATLWKYIACADIGLAVIENTGLSYYLAAPTKLYEYMMAGIPVIASDFPEIRDVLETAHCGILVNPSSSENIAETILYLGRDASLRKRLGASARRSAMREFNWQKEEPRLLDELRRLVIS